MVNGGERSPAVPQGAAPSDALMLVATGVWTAQALWAAASLGIADVVAAAPRTAAEIAAATGAREGPVRRILRALAALGIFAETSDGRVGNTPQSELLRSDVPGSLRDFVVMLGQRWHVAAFGELLHSVHTGRPGVERVLGKSLWEHFAADPEQGRIFDAAMTGVVAGAAMALRDVYDFGGVRTLVDVGGGHGFVLGSVLAANPQVRGVLFDQPQVVSGAGPVLERLGVAERVTIVGGDFFAQVPRGDAYVLSHILHDWDDERATAILRTIARAAEPRARLLVVETVIPPGNAYSFGKILDLEMLALAGGLERTEKEYRTLLEAGGFRLTRVLGTPVFTDVVEAVLA
jgi:hypothetical protein